MAVAREVPQETGLVVTVGDLIGSVVRTAERGSYESYDHFCQAAGGRPHAREDAAVATRIDGVIFAALDQAGTLTEGLGEALGGRCTVPQITKNRPAR